MRTHQDPVDFHVRVNVHLHRGRASVAAKEFSEAAAKLVSITNDNVTSDAKL